MARTHFPVYPPERHLSPLSFPAGWTAQFNPAQIVRVASRMPFIRVVAMPRPSTIRSVADFVPDDLEPIETATLRIERLESPVSSCAVIVASDATSLRIISEHPKYISAPHPTAQRKLQRAISAYGRYFAANVSDGPLIAGFRPEQVDAIIQTMACGEQPGLSTGDIEAARDLLAISPRQRPLEHIDYADAERRLMAMSQREYDFEAYRHWDSGTDPRTGMTRQQRRETPEERRERFMRMYSGRPGGPMHRSHHRETSQLRPVEEWGEAAEALISEHRERWLGSHEQLPDARTGPAPVPSLAYDDHTPLHEPVEKQEALAPPPSFLPAQED